MLRCLAALTVLLVAVLAVDLPTGNHTKIDIDVWNDLHEKPSVNAIVEFAGMRKFWSDNKEYADLDKPSSNIRVRDLLRSVASRAQENARLILEKKVPHRRRLDNSTEPEVCPGVDDVVLQDLWVANQFKVFSLTLCIAEQLSNLPRVSRIRYGYTMKLDTPAITQDATGTNSWGVAAVGAPNVWANGHQGQGIIVGSIDSGVRYTHDALKSNFRGDYGWFDAVNATTTPMDVNGHGTHTMGTIAGSHGIGVAPGVSWMACRACSSSECLEADLLTCMQFMLCPTDVYGKNEDCKKYPRVVNNSWGAGATDIPSYKAAIEAWRRAGIIPVFSNGNTGGSGCGSVQSPADYDNVISVGNVDSSGLLSPTSSRGPTKLGSIKPNIAAPGVAIVSASFSSDTQYATMSGTSMAAPHVTGAIALLLSQNPSYGYDDVLKILTSTADTSKLQATTPQICGSLNSIGVFPNNHYGSGQLNLVAAFAPTSTPPITLSPNTSAPAPVPVNVTTVTPVATSRSPTIPPSSAGSSSSNSPYLPSSTPSSNSVPSPTTPGPTLPPSSVSPTNNTDVVLVAPNNRVVATGNGAVQAMSVLTSAAVHGVAITYRPATQQLVSSSGECLDASPIPNSSGYVLHLWPCRLSNINQRWVVKNHGIQHGRHPNLCMAVVASSVGVAACDSTAPSQQMSALPLNVAMDYLSK
ncbi:serine protease family S08A [Thraustotheca clavata]|uniref:subtilisin n=1 Tax=Thraustotheca clavata TaxID=74557 RepID=A0A0A7CLP8_9STRA|nr:secreted protein [Thraustotheca clavata]OQS07469.1 serine protease family S08A [Thraustotheca clavata]